MKMGGEPPRMGNPPDDYGNSLICCNTKFIIKQYFNLIILINLIIYNKTYFLLSIIIKHNIIKIFLILLKVNILI